MSTAIGAPKVCTPAMLTARWEVTTTTAPSAPSRGGYAQKASAASALSGSYKVAQSPQVAAPHHVQDRLGAQRAHRPTQPPRERDALGPREARATVAGAPQGEAARAGEETVVLDREPARRVPRRDLHAIDGAERSDARDAV